MISHRCNEVIHCDITSRFHYIPYAPSNKQLVIKETIYCSFTGALCCVVCLLAVGLVVNNPLTNNLNCRAIWGAQLKMFNSSTRHADLNFFLPTPINKTPKTYKQPKSFFRCTSNYLRTMKDPARDVHKSEVVQLSLQKITQNKKSPSTLAQVLANMLHLSAVIIQL